MSKRAESHRPTDPSRETSSAATRALLAASRQRASSAGSDSEESEGEGDSTDASDAEDSSSDESSDNYDGPAKARTTRAREESKRAVGEDEEDDVVFVTDGSKKVHGLRTVDCSYPALMEQEGADRLSATLACLSTADAVVTLRADGGDRGAGSVLHKESMRTLTKNVGRAIVTLTKYVTAVVLHHAMEVLDDIGRWEVSLSTTTTDMDCALAEHRGPLTSSSAPDGAPAFRLRADATRFEDMDELLMGDEPEERGTSRWAFASAPVRKSLTRVARASSSGPITVTDLMCLPAMIEADSVSEVVFHVSATVYSRSKSAVIDRVMFSSFDEEGIPMRFARGRGSLVNAIIHELSLKMLCMRSTSREFFLPNAHKLIPFRIDATHLATKRLPSGNAELIWKRKTTKALSFVVNGLKWAVKREIAEVEKKAGWEDDEAASKYVDELRQTLDALPLLQEMCKAATSLFFRMHHLTNGSLADGDVWASLLELAVQPYNAIEFPKGGVPESLCGLVEENYAKLAYTHSLLWSEGIGKADPRFARDRMGMALGALDLARIFRGITQKAAKHLIEKTTEGLKHWFANMVSEGRAAGRFKWVLDDIRDALKPGRSSDKDNADAAFAEFLRRAGLEPVPERVAGKQLCHLPDQMKMTLMRMDEGSRRGSRGRGEGPYEWRGAREALHAIMNAVRGSS